MEECKILQSDCYTQFACKAAGCRNTCCKGWSITLSKAEYLKMKSGNMPPELAATAKTALHRIRKDSSDLAYAAVTLNENDECPYLSEERLCHIQMHMGADSLSKTCRVFPRVHSLINNTLYSVLTMGCEAVVEQLLTKQTPITMQAHTVKVASAAQQRALYNDLTSKGEHLFFDELFFVTTAILQNAAYTIKERITLLSLALDALPSEDDFAASFPAWFVKYAPIGSRAVLRRARAAKRRYRRGF